MKNKDYCIKDFQKILNKSKSDYFQALFGYHNYHNQIYSILKNSTSTKNCQNDNNLLIKICMPDEGISAFTLSHLLNDLYIVNRELNKIFIQNLNKYYGKELGIKKIFELNIKEVHPGSCTIVLEFLLSKCVIPFLEGAFGKNIDDIFRDFGKATTAIIKDKFIEHFTTKPNYIKYAKNSNKKMNNAIADFYKRMDNMENVKEVQFISVNRTENITKDKMIDFYA